MDMSVEPHEDEVLSNLPTQLRLRPDKRAHPPGHSTSVKAVPR